MIIQRKDIETVSVTLPEYLLIKQEKIRSLPCDIRKKYIQIVCAGKHNLSEAMICKRLVSSEKVTHFKKAITLNYIIKWEKN